MNADAKAKWVEALRSGCYEQGQSALQSGEHKFCCLGVLCDISGLGTWQEKEPGDVYGYLVDMSTWAPVGLPPIEVYAWIGASTSQLLPFVRLNDNGVSFEEIASKIEETL